MTQKWLPDFYQPQAINAGVLQPRLQKAGLLGRQMSRDFRPASEDPIKTLMMIVDMTNGFMHFDDESERELPVKNMDLAVRNLAEFIYGHGSEVITDYMIFFDHHFKFQIDSQEAWRLADGSMPNWWEPIFLSDFETRVWPFRPKDRNRFLKFLQRTAPLVESGQMAPLMPWPTHSRAGTPGEALVGTLAEAIEWQSNARGIDPYFIPKGYLHDEPWYGAFESVLGKLSGDDPYSFIRRFDRILVAGIAGDVCLMGTMEQHIDWFGPNGMDDNPETLANTFYMTDMTALVFPDAREKYDEHLLDMTKNYINVLTTEQLINTL